VLVPRLIHHQTGVESVVGQVGDLHATQMAAEVGDHVGEDVMSHRSRRSHTLQRHGDGLRFE